MSTTQAPSPSSSNVSGVDKTPVADSPSLSTSVRRGALWSGSSTLLLRLSNVAITAVVAHILAPRDFGVFTVALTAYTIVFNLAELGVGSCIIRADLDIDALAPTMVTVALVTSAMAAEVMAVFAEPIATALGSADGAESVRIMALTVLIGGISSVPSGQLTRDFRQDKLFLANVLSLLPSTAALFILAKSGSGATAFAWSRVIAAVVMFCVMFASVQKHYMPGISRQALSILFRFGMPLAGANFINFILINVDYAFVGHLMGPVALGAYVLAFTIASSPGLLLGNVINSISMPAFSRVKHDPDRLRNAISSALRAISLILMPMSGLMMVLSLPLVYTLYGAKWAASVEVLSILSFYGAISVICVLFANILTSLGKAKFTLVVQLLWIGALVPAMILGVHRDGIVGAAVAHIAVIGPLVLPCYLFALRKAVGVRFAALGKAVFPPFLAALAAALAARSAASQFASPLGQLMSGLAVGSLIYVVAAAPQAVVLLSEKQTEKLRALRLFRAYGAAARMVGLTVNGGPVQRGKGDSHRTRDSAGPATGPGLPGLTSATLTMPSVDEHSGQDAVTTVRVTRLLRPEGRVVPFWPRPELDELLRWSRAPGQVAIRLVTGEGGAGKTRLAVELARILEDDGWQPLWVPPGGEPGAMSAARRIARPTVLLIDDAETRTGLPGFLADTADGLGGPDLRVVLLARNSGDWWQELASGGGYRLGALLTADRPVRLRPVPRGAVQTEVFEAAVTEFAARLGVARPATRLALSDPDASVLILHTAALCAVLDHIERAVDEHPRSSADALECLLRHELRYCAQAAAARGLGLDPGAQRRAVAASCLIGADSESAAAAMLGRMPGLAGSAEQPGQVARWLRDLYPGPAAGSGGAEWLGPMYPDRVAEHLIVGELAAQPGLIPALFNGLDDHRAKKALTVLGRAAPNYPDAVALLARALAADPEHLALPALRVALETNPVMDRLIADAVATGAIPAEALERIAAAIPRRSLALAKTAETVLQRLAGASSGGSAERQLAQ
jgi:PST family polysaccharide transporter